MILSEKSATFRDHAPTETIMQDLVTHATQLAARLKQRGETIAVAESSTGGMISAALLAVPGASAYFIGGAVVYTKAARRALLDISDDAMEGMRPSTEAYALLVARTARARFATTWAIGESGATGPTGNRYGDAAGHSCIAVVGPVERALTIETGSTDRFGNMSAFTAAALDLLMKVMDGAR
jgi:nicotinamide-nucleotide amidase